MNYIKLTQSDIDFVKNKAVICSIEDTNELVLFEPLSSELQTHFENHERFKTFDDHLIDIWDYDTNYKIVIKLNHGIKNSLIFAIIKYVKTNNLNYKIYNKVAVVYVDTILPEHLNIINNNIGIQLIQKNL